MPSLHDCPECQFTPCAGLRGLVLPSCMLTGESTYVRMVSGSNSQPVCVPCSHTVECIGRS